MSEREEWSNRIRGIARDWFFGDVVDEPVPRVVVLPLENPDLHDHEAFTSRLSDVSHYRSVTIGDHGGVRFGVMRSKFGAASVITTVDVLADSGVTDVVGVGFCGGLVADVACGALVVPVAAVREDGVSERHVPLGFPAIADPGHVRALERECEVQGIPARLGIVWTVDSPRSETSAAVDQWSTLGVVGVDMESAALFVLARARGLRASSLLVASDNAALGTYAEAEPLRAGVVAAAGVSLAVAAAIASAQSAISRVVARR